MTRLATLGLGDLRRDLPRRSWEIGRNAHKTTITLHYNGPAVANRTHAAEIAQLIGDARYHMRPGGVGAANGADGIQYHLAILSDGTFYQLRDLDAELWHCANAAGNSSSIAIHLPLGGTQDATAPQWQAFGVLSDALIADYRMAGRSAVRGHREWPRSDGKPQSTCPGPLLMARLIDWRQTRTSEPACLRFRVIVDVVNIREGKGTQYPVALHGTATLARGTVFDASEIVIGTPVAGDPRWVHRADQIGFVHMSCVEQVAA